MFINRTFYPQETTQYPLDRGLVNPAAGLDVEATRRNRETANLKPLLKVLRDKKARPLSS